MTAGSSSTPTDALAPRDLDDKRKDVYEWEAAGARQSCRQRLLGYLHRDQPLRLEPARVSADGTDAYFFTRDTLVPQDRKRRADQDL